MSFFDPSNPSPQSIPGVHVPGSLDPLNSAMPWLDQGRGPRRIASAGPHSNVAAEERAAARLRLIGEISRTPDPIERLLRAVVTFVETTGTYEKDRYFRLDEEALRACVPDLWTEDVPINVGDDPSWDSAAIAEWFAPRAQEPAGSVSITRSGFLGTKKPKVVPGWGFASGSSSFRVGEGSRGLFGPISVTSEGRVVEHGVIAPGAAFNAIALSTMATWTLGPGVVPERKDANGQLRDLFGFMSS